MSELRVYDLRNRFMSPELGRFLQPDPIGFKGDASNLYRYCGNDPVDRIDPMGTEYQVVVQDSTHVTINIPIIWKGEANSKAYQAAFTSGIQQRWSGTWGAVTVRTVVTDGSKVDKYMANTVYIKKGEGTSKVLGGHEGHWYEKEEGGKLSRESVGAHEAGHFLGLRDAYQKDGPFRAKIDEYGNILPQKGYDACNIMVTANGTPDVRDISQILGGDGIGYRGGAPNGGGSGEAGNTRRSFDAYGSTTETAALWEVSYGYGGWLAADRNFGR